jgi:hypothetical protein
VVDGVMRRGMFGPECASRVFLWSRNICYLLILTINCVFSRAIFCYWRTNTHETLIQRRFTGMRFLRLHIRALICSGAPGRLLITKAA